MRYGSNDGELQCDGRMSIVDKRKEPAATGPVAHGGLHGRLKIIFKSPKLAGLCIVLCSDTHDLFQRELERHAENRSGEDI